MCVCACVLLCVCVYNQAFLHTHTVMNITLQPDSITLTEDSVTVEFTVSRDTDTILNRTIRIDVAFLGDTASRE